MCSINLSGQSLGDDKFLPYVIDQFHHSGLDATKICFESPRPPRSQASPRQPLHPGTEGAGLQVRARRLRNRLVVLRLFEALPGGIFLKIDGSFVKEILHDPIDREMVRSINEIGHLTGKQTIAEFAENLGGSSTCCARLGVDYAQAMVFAAAADTQGAEPRYDSPAPFQPHDRSSVGLLSLSGPPAGRPTRSAWTVTARTCLVMLPTETKSTPVRQSLEWSPRDAARGFEFQGMVGEPR